MSKFVCTENSCQNNVNNPFKKNVKLVRNFINPDAFLLASDRVSTPLHSYNCR